MDGEQRVAEVVQNTLQHSDEGAGSLTPPPQAFIAAAVAAGGSRRCSSTQPQPPERSTATGDEEQAQPAPRQTLARFPGPAESAGRAAHYHRAATCKAARLHATSRGAHSTIESHSNRDKVKSVVTLFATLVQHLRQTG